MAKIDEAQARHEEQAERDEEKRLGPPEFGALFAAQVEDLPVEFYTPVAGQKVLNTVVIKRMNDDEMERYKNAGQEVNLREDRDAQSGAKVQMVRDMSESKEMLFKHAIRNFKLATGVLGPDGEPAFYSYDGVNAGKRREIFRDLDPEVANWLADQCRAHNGLSGNAAGGVLSAAS